MATTVTIGGSGTLFVGEDKQFQLGPITDEVGAQVDISTWVIVFDVRKKDNSADPAIFSKTAAVTGVFNSNPLNNTQRAIVVLTDTEMNTVKAGTYRHSWKRMDDGSETVLCRGPFTPEKATAP